MPPSEQLHLIVSHIPFIGVGVGTIALLVGVLSKSKAAIFAGLLGVLLCSSLIPTVMASGEMAYRNYTQKPETYGIDAEGLAWAKVHFARAETGSKPIYAASFFSLIGLLSMKLFPKHTRWLAIFTIICGVASVAAGFWVSSVAAEIRRPDFRRGPAPEVELHEN